MYWATSTRLCKAVHEQNSVCWPSVEPHDMKPKATVNVTVTVTVIVTVAVNVHCHFAVSVGQKAMVQACRRGMQHVPGRGTGGHAHERWTDVGRGGGRQHLVHLLHYRAPSSDVALAWLQHNLLAHPDGGLPERDVGEGCPHGAASHLHLQLHAANKALFLGTEVALLKVGAALLQKQAWVNPEQAGLELTCKACCCLCRHS